MNMEQTLLIRTPIIKHHLFAETVNTSCYICTRLLINSKREAITPYKVINGKNPEMNYFKIFGCRAFAYKAEHQRDVAREYEDVIEFHIMDSNIFISDLQALHDECNDNGNDTMNEVSTTEEVSDGHENIKETEWNGDASTELELTGKISQQILRYDKKKCQYRTATN